MVTLYKDKIFIKMKTHETMQDFTNQEDRIEVTLANAIAAAATPSQRISSCSWLISQVRLAAVAAAANYFVARVRVREGLETFVD